MAQTDQRTGFRLPWASDQRSNGDSPVKDGSPDADPQDTAAAEASLDAPDDRADTTNEHTDDATAGTVGVAETDTAGPDAVDHPASETDTVPADTLLASATPATGVPRKPSKFMADLTKAMQAAAESAQATTMSQLLADAKLITEEIQGRSTELASDLRKRADDDVAGIRDWQKAEIARIKEETDQRISGRKGDLETQLGHHAAVIQQAIEKVQSQVSAFETDMARFFETLLSETDPTRFAAMAENLPEPPPFEGLAIGVEEIMAQAAAAVAVIAPPAKPEPKVESVTEAPETEAVAADAVAEAVETEAVETEAGESGAAEAGMAHGRAEDNGGPQTEMDREAAMAAIASAFEAAAQAEAEAARAEFAAERAEAAAGTGHENADGENAGMTAEAGTAEGETEGEDDPRIAALGLSPSDAAEAEAAAGAESNDLEIATIGEDDLANRLGNLIPDRVSYPERQSAKTNGPTKTTQVVVVGLVSVASIASFKRHLGRVSGVQSVGVSSGPDGEFVFAVAHAEDVSLRDQIPGLPGFHARVTNTGDGIVNVTARDPESEG